jgi:hypothetical protein
VEVVSSGVTTVAIPLISAYVAIGVVRDTKGDAIPGARVEATNSTTKTKVFSITNDAGFYTLEGLEQGEYRIKVSDLAPKTDKLKITPTSQPTQELNLTIDIPTEKTEQTPTSTPTTLTKPANISPSVSIDHQVNF